VGSKGGLRSCTLAQVQLTVGRGIEPMLASTATSVADALAVTGPASVEWKLDGIRVQVHRAGDDVRVYTRNLNEVSARLPDLVALARVLPAERFVLDGELLGRGADGEAPGLFQDTASGFSRGECSRTEPSERTIVLAPAFFDCLHLDGQDMVAEPLRLRVAVLADIVGTLRVPALETDDADAAQAFLDSALAAGHEGVMVKALDTPYEAGRRGKRWLKVKPVRTLDLVVLAAEWGHGRRRGKLSNLHLGARGDDGFVMVGKTFKGLTDAVLESQTAELLARETHREGIVVYVRPELVVEIALDGVQRSTRYPGGVALRFARVRRYRDDKTAAQAETIDTVRALLPGTPGSG
jgi:DNA ligase-1